MRIYPKNLIYLMSILKPHREAFHSMCLWRDSHLTERKSGEDLRKISSKQLREITSHPGDTRGTYLSRVFISIDCVQNPMSKFFERLLKLRKFLRVDDKSISYKLFCFNRNLTISQIEIKEERQRHAGDATQHSHSLQSFYFSCC